jgi:hypothetical protein
MRTVVRCRRPDAPAPPAVRRWGGPAAAALVALLALPACSSAGQEEAVPPIRENAPRIERVPNGQEPVPASGGADTAAVPAELLAAARADLDRRLAAESASGPVRVLVAEAVTWSDGALGCPRPGMNYTMALVPGYRVVFAVGSGAAERRYAYHSGRAGPLAYCPNPGMPVGGSSAI